MLDRGIGFGEPRVEVRGRGVEVWRKVGVGEVERRMRRRGRILPRERGRDVGERAELGNRDEVERLEQSESCRGVKRRAGCWGKLGKG